MRLSKNSDKVGEKVVINLILKSFLSNCVKLSQHPSRLTESMCTIDDQKPTSLSPVEQRRRIRNTQM